MGYEEIFRALALGDVELLGSSWDDLTSCVGLLDGRSHGIAHLSALIALGASEPSISVAITAAIGAGVTTDEVIAVVLSLAPVVGTARVIETAPAVGMAVNIDIDRLLERP